MTCIDPRGAAGSNQPPPWPPPPPPPDTKVFKHVFLQIEIFGKTSGATGAKYFFPHTWYGVKLFISPMCVYSKYSAHIGDFKISGLLAIDRITSKPAPKSAKKSQQIGKQNRRTDFSPKQVPSDLDLSPRAQTHLPFGCSVVGVVW